MNGEAFRRPGAFLRFLASQLPNGGDLQARFEGGFLGPEMMGEPWVKPSDGGNASKKGG